MLTVSLYDGLIVYVNKDFTRFLGYDHDEFIEEEIQLKNFYVNVEKYNDMLNELREKDAYDSKEVAFRKKDGTTITGLISSKIVALNGDKFIFSNIQSVKVDESINNKSYIAFELEAREREIIVQNKNTIKQKEKLVIANQELDLQTKQKEKYAADLLIANNELVFENKEKTKRASELFIAYKDLALKSSEKENLAAELIIANKELAFQNSEKEDRAAELLIANKELAFQNGQKEDRAAELLIANKELAFQNNEKENRAAELLIANKELAFQNGEKENRAAELLIANKELAFQNSEKEDRAAELLIANKELAFQNSEKENRAAELLIANKELAFQNSEKENRAAELLIANKELAFQNGEKENRAAELLIANKELAFQNGEKEDRAAELLIKQKAYQKLVSINDENLYLSYRDQLTGLYNRRFYNEQLKILDTEENLPFSVIVGDINGLKLVNDTFGHTMGDFMLKKAAELIEKGSGSVSDSIVSRTGGDEFVILLPKTDIVETEVIIKQISDLLLKEKLGSITISISFGGATKNNKEDNINEVFQQADKEMYRRKNILKAKQKMERQ